MKQWKVISLLVLVCTIGTSVVLAYGEEHVLYDFPDYIEDLRTYCPHTMFCRSNDTFHTGVDPSSNGTPCCRSCSCEEDCGLKKTCCFDKDDQHNRGDEDCISTGLGRGISSALPYYMIQSCTNEEDQCNNASIASWGAMYPVYSPFTQLIYLNEQCALCNGVHDVVTWDIKFYCIVGVYVDNSISDEISDLLSGKTAEFCSMMFMPPVSIDVTDLSCSNDIIRNCFELSGREELNVSEDIISLCSSFNATFIVTLRFQEIQVKFGNVFCAMCNLEEWNTGSESMCVTSPFLERSPFTPVMVGLLSGVKPETIRTDRPEVCRDPEIKVACKPLVCPEGQIRVNQDCQFVVSLRGEMYVVFLRLTPRADSPPLPVSHFDDLSHVSLSFGHWLSRGKLQNWKPIVYYRLTDDKIHIEFIIVSLYLKKKVDLSVVLNNVKESLKTSWYALLKNERYFFDTKLNRFTQYEHVEGIVYTPIDDPSSPLKNKDDNGENVLVLNMEMGQSKSKSIQITAFYFCNQVDILPSEYSEIESGIYIKAHNFSLKRSDYRVISDGERAMRVRTCADKWLSGNSNAAVSNYIHSFFDMLIATYVFICFFKYCTKNSSF